MDNPCHRPFSAEDPPATKSARNSDVDMSSSTQTSQGPGGPDSSTSFEGVLISLSLCTREAKKRKFIPWLKVLLAPAILANTEDNLISRSHVAVLAAILWNNPCEPEEKLETSLCVPLKGWLARKSVAFVS